MARKITVTAGQAAQKARIHEDEVVAVVTAGQAAQKEGRAVTTCPPGVTAGQAAQKRLAQLAGSRLSRDCRTGSSETGPSASAQPSARDCRTGSSER